MAHFAKVENGIVTNILVIEQEVLNSGLWGDPSLWIQTSYNTIRGIHYLPDSNTPSGQPHVRGNFAGLGHIYDKELDVFYEPSPYPSWTLNKTTFSWEPPVPKPENYNRWDFDWNEETKSWIEKVHAL